MLWGLKIINRYAYSVGKLFMRKKLFKNLVAINKSSTFVG